LIDAPAGVGFDGGANKEVRQMPDEVDLQFISRQLTRVLDDLASLKEDVIILKADMTALRESVRAFEGRVDNKLDALGRKLDRYERRLRDLEDVRLAP